ncbi:unnamed protein product [Vitrella brassicaformis CCMP3155]|uniref:Uncharacterized protein n=1 Tax=Vitrella brassicaformis (strain CCMP3155) TaxID=1169540 RepID=A0A0G4FSL5_VITBC|nr:unnamed protein product [Vitrella brassicaformis CCMP3155]|eukprot:CEM17226.1 unnamed protein product [Vitrella brassicaformis CCMP3155]
MSGYLWLLSNVGLVVGAGGVLVGIHTQNHDRIIEKWTEVQGEITSSGVSYLRPHGLIFAAVFTVPGMFLKIHYKYTPTGTNMECSGHTSHRLTFDQKGHESSEDWKRPEVIEAYQNNRKGYPIKVRYNPVEWRQSYAVPEGVKQLQVVDNKTFIMASAGLLSVSMLHLYVDKLLRKRRALR